MRTIAPLAVAMRRVPELEPEVAEKVVLLAEHDLEVAQRRVVRPDRAREGGLLRRDGEHEQVVDRQQRPDQDGDADQEEPRLVGDAAERRHGHRESRFIMK